MGHGNARHHRPAQREELSVIRVTGRIDDPQMEDALFGEGYNLYLSDRYTITSPKSQ
jgi:hypothetical protein